jgi:hypothetical protein
MEDDIELCAIAADYLQQALSTVPPKKVNDLLEDWAKGHLQDDPDEADVDTMFVLSLDACLFAPSMSGSTPMSRFIAGVRTDDPASRRAIQLLSRSEIRIVRIGQRIDPDLVELEDSLSGERLMLVDSEFVDASNGFETLLRLCRLDSGRYFLINLPIVLTPSAREIVDTFVRPGKGIGNSYRCTCAVYKHAIREGVVEVPVREPTEDEIAEAVGAKIEAAAALLDSEWAAARDDPEARAEFVAELGEIASVDSVMSYVQMYNLALDGHISASPGNLLEICVVLIGALNHRKQGGSAEAEEALEEIRRTIAGHVDEGELNEQCRILIESFFL